MLYVIASFVVIIAFAVMALSHDPPDIGPDDDWDGAA